MRALASVVLAAILAAPVRAQAPDTTVAVTALPFGSADNRIELVVANVDTQPLGDVTVHVAEAPAWLTIQPAEIALGELGAGSEAATAFTLGVKADAPVDRVGAVRFNISTGGVGVSDRTFALKVAAPSEIALHPNFPNPFQTSTTIGYELPEQARVRLEVFDVLGRRVTQLVDVEAGAGYHVVELDARLLASGLYVVRLVVNAGGGWTVMHRRVTVSH